MLINNQIATAASELEQLVRYLNAYNPTAQILLAKIIPFSRAHEGLNSQVYWFNVAVDDLAARLRAQGWNRLHVVDMNTGFPKEDGLGWDGIHPTPEGYKWMARKWKKIAAVGCN